MQWNDKGAVRNIRRQGANQAGDACREAAGLFSSEEIT